MATAIDDFTVWLDKKLKDLNTDEGVFGSYITGILDGDDTTEEKTEAIEGILSEIINQDIDIIRKEIMDMWCKLRLPKDNHIKELSSEEVDIKLARLLETQASQITKQKNYTEEEKRIREAILSQYSNMTDDEEEDDDDFTECSEHKENGIEKNRNAQSVMQAEKEKREQAKIESQKKKDKDKEDREKQKNLKEEKKEKRKTQKGERRR